MSETAPCHEAEGEALNNKSSHGSNKENRRIFRELDLYSNVSETRQDTHFYAFQLKAAPFYQITHSFMSLRADLFWVIYALKCSLHFTN